jgi:phosphoglycolate phosphatase
MKKIILFDFDGVIVDSLKLSFETHRKNNNNETLQQYRELFLGNIYSSHRGEDLLKNKAVVDFFSEYKEGLMKHKCVLEMPKIIKNLSKKYTLIIISSTFGEIIDKFLQKNNLRQYFAEIMGPEVDKDKTVKIKMVLEKYNVLTEECVFITDTVGDIKEGRCAGVESVGVIWGFHTREMLEDAKPFAIAKNPSELFEIISRS